MYTCEEKIQKSSNPSVSSTKKQRDNRRKETGSGSLSDFNSMCDTMNTKVFHFEPGVPSSEDSTKQDARKKEFKPVVEKLVEMGRESDSKSGDDAFSISDTNSAKLVIIDEQEYQKNPHFKDPSIHRSGKTNALEYRKKSNSKKCPTFGKEVDDVCEPFKIEKMICVVPPMDEVDGEEEAGIKVKNSFQYLKSRRSNYRTFQCDSCSWYVTHSCYSFSPNPLVIRHTNAIYSCSACDFSVIHAMHIERRDGTPISRINKDIAALEEGELIDDESMAKNYINFHRNAKEQEDEKIFHTMNRKCCDLEIRHKCTYNNYMICDVTPLMYYDNDHAINPVNFLSTAWKCEQCWMYMSHDCQAVERTNIVPTFVKVVSLLFLITFMRSNLKLGGGMNI